MALDFYSTHTLLAAIEQLTPPKTFLRDRYFPTDDNTDLFSTNDVLVEYKDGSKKLAPFVAPRKGGVTILRKGSSMLRFIPPFIAPRRQLTIDDLKKRGFGEALYSKLTPAQRDQVLILKDADELGELISRREEKMAAEVLQTNGCIMFHIADDKDKGDEMEIRFYEGDVNPAQYVPIGAWTPSYEYIIDDMYNMAKLLRAKGLAATEMLIDSIGADAILNNTKIQKLLDIKNYNIGGVDPASLPEGAARIARVNVKGVMVDVISYDESYEDENGNDVPFLSPGTIIMTAPAIGRTLYGAVSQVEESNGPVITRMGRRVPKYISDVNTNTRSLTLTSCPLPIVNNKNPFIKANIL